MFSKNAWQQIRPTYRMILNHPFVRELAEGSLCQNRFHNFLCQDVLYLVDYSRSLSHLAARSKDPDTIQVLIRFAQSAIAEERSLQKNYLFNHSNVEKNSACDYYCDFLLRTSRAHPIGVGLAAMLPCMMIYQSIGKFIIENGAKNNPYQAWIDQYAHPEFASTTQLAIDLTNRFADIVDNKEQKLMWQSFGMAADLELEFFEAAYHLPSKHKPRYLGTSCIRYLGVYHRISK